MIFEQENLSMQLLDVMYFDESGLVVRTKERPFCALSLRIEGDTEIVLKNHTAVRLGTHDLAFFPEELGYVRRAKRDRMIVFHFTVQGHEGREIEVLHHFRYDTMLPLFEEALCVWQERAPGYRYRAAALLYRIFAEIRSGMDAGKSKISSTVAEALEKIAGRYRDPALTVAGLAAEAHMSETYFRRLFQKDLGISPKQYLDVLRMERAKELLNAGYDTVSAVAEKVGFRDSKNFATAFKKTFGYPPSKQHYEL